MRAHTKKPIAPNYHSIDALTNSLNMACSRLRQNNMRPKAKFLTVVWGETYITRFASLALPSFLALGNLPALAQSTELEVVIMTRHDDIEYFEKHATFHRLRAICPVRFVEIDDLITTTVYGVTLTLAYARPVIACGREMLDIHFVFMNADFVLADGSLRALCRHILAGRAIVLGPSFRATAEAVEPRLEAAVDTASGILTVSPRQLAALSLAHPHPTTVAKTLTQDFCHSTHPNQFFWQVDEQTMLGRYYLIFMLCLKPERIISTINCFCDYAFIPEMCPSGDEAIMNDSDDFFMLELQQRAQEMHMLRLGRQSDHEIIDSLQYWTTAEHRRAAGHDIVFHAGEIPAGIELAKMKARAFIGKIEKQLGRPVPHARHRYWIRGVEAWKSYRMEQGLSASPPELAAASDRFQDWLSWNDMQSVLNGIRSSALRWLWSFIYAGRRVILGKMQMTPLHPYWLDYRLLRDTIADILFTPVARVLVVRDRSQPVDYLVGADAPARFATLQEVLNGGPPPPKQGADGYTHVLIYLQRKDCRSVQALLKQCQSAMTPGGTYQVFIHHLLGETENTNFSHELVRYVEDIIGWPPRETVCSFVGGSLKRFNSRLFMRISRHYARFGIWALLWILPLLAIGLPLTLLSNLYLTLRLPSHHYINHCSSVAIRFNRGEDAPRDAAMRVRTERAPG